MIEFREAVQKEEYQKDQTYREMVNASIRECFESDECKGIYGYMFGRPYVRTSSYIRSDKVIYISKANGDPYVAKKSGAALVYIWGFPGPDYNIYEFADYGFTWAFNEEEIVCPICYKCDTRIRLHMCQGRKGNFKYCFRKAGSLDGLEKTITPFDTIDDLFENQVPYIQDLVKESLLLSSEDYANEFQCLMYGRFKDSAENELYPVGFVTKLYTGGINNGGNSEDV